MGGFGYYESPIILDFGVRRLIHRGSEVGQLKAPAAETVGNPAGC
jgi:hypothetical protein